MEVAAADVLRGLELPDLEAILERSPGREYKLCEDDGFSILDDNVSFFYAPHSFYNKNAISLLFKNVSPSISFEYLFKPNESRPPRPLICNYIFLDKEEHGEEIWHEDPDDKVQNSWFERGGKLLEQAYQKYMEKYKFVFLLNAPGRKV